jgi:hypothetical protein
MTSRPAFRAAALLGLFTALTTLLTYPLSLEPGSRAIAMSADTRLFLWTIAWDLHALVEKPLRLFDANIFFPERHTLAYSEHLVGSALVGAPWFFATGSPLLAMNAVVLLSCVFSGLGAYFLARRVGVGVLGAVAAGIIFAFAPPRFSRLGQLHLAVVQWIPFCLGFLHSYLAKGAPGDLRAACAFFTLQALSSGHGGLFLLLAIAGLIAYEWAFGVRVPMRRLLKDFGLLGLALLALNLWFLIPYLEVRRDVGLHRTIGAIEDWAPNAVSFLAAPTHLQGHLLGKATIAKARAFLFPGWSTLLLVLVSLFRRGEGPPAAPEKAVRTPRGLVVLDGVIVAAAVAAFLITVSDGFEWSFWGVNLSARSARRPLVICAVLLSLRWLVVRRTPFAWAQAVRRGASSLGRWLEARVGIEGGYYVLLALGSLWASLGPSFGLYTVLYRFVPGFDLVRVPSRLAILTLLSLAVLAGMGLERLSARRRGPWIPVLIVLLAEFAAFPLDARPYEIPEPAIDRTLASLEGPLVELPVADPKDAVASARLQSLYLLHSLAHFHPMVNGYSGFIPPRHEELFRLLVDFPDEESLRALEKLGVLYAVVHRDLYKGDDWDRAESRLQAFSGRLRLVRAEKDGFVYALVPASDSAPNGERRAVER